MLMLNVLIFCILSINVEVKSANILALFPVNEISHFIVYKPFLIELTKKGHNVDVFGHFPRDAPLTRYTDLSLKGTTPLIEHFDLNFIKHSTMLQHLDVIYNKFGHEMCQTIGNSTITKQLKNSTKKYDLIVTEIFFSDCLLGFAQIFDAPIIGLITSVNLPWISDFIGIPDNPSYIPNYHSRYPEKMNFFQRMHNAVTLTSAKFWYRRSMDISNRYFQENFGDITKGVHLNEFIKNISLVMVNSHFSIHGSRPMPPNFVEVGGMHINEHPLLPKEFEEYLKTNLKGVIYVSFGTLFKSELFQQDKIETIFKVLENVPYKVLWKGDSKLLPKHFKVPRNIHFVKWVPQLELLCHPNLTLFISHCGCASVLESVYCGTPILGLPIWGDQFLNANVAVSKKTGISIPFFDITQKNFFEGIHKILKDLSYSINAKKLSTVFRDRIETPLNTAIYWTEYVIRNKGAKHLRTKGADLSWFSYYCLDLLIVPIVIIFILTAIVLNIFIRANRYIYRKLKID